MRPEVGKRYAWTSFGTLSVITVVAVNYRVVRFMYPDSAEDRMSIGRWIIEAWAKRLVPVASHDPRPTEPEAKAA